MGITWALTTLVLRKYGTFAAYTQSEEIGLHQELRSTPNGIRTRAATLKGWKVPSISSVGTPGHGPFNRANFSLEDLAGTLRA